MPLPASGGGGSDYTGEPVSFAPLGENRLSLRPSGTAPIPLSVLLGVGGTQVVESFLHNRFVAN